VLAFIFKNLLIESKAQSHVINTPNNNTVNDTKIITSNVMTFINSGSRVINHKALPHNMASATSADKMPIQKFRRKKGFLIKAQLAPTHFMV